MTKNEDGALQPIRSKTHAWEIVTSWLDNPLGILAESLNAVSAATSGQSHAVSTIAAAAGLGVRLVINRRKDQAGRAILSELQEAVGRGEVKREFVESEDGEGCLLDFLNAIDGGEADPARYKAIRSAFLGAMRLGPSGRDAIYTRQLLKRIYALSGDEIIVLAAIWQSGSGGQYMTPVLWQNEIANKTGMLRSEFVADIEAGLTKKRLLMPRGNDNDVVNDWGVRSNRLTQLGVEVCEKIIKE